MPHVSMAARGWIIGECEQLVRLYENHPRLYNTTNEDYKDKNKRIWAIPDNNCNRTQSDILFLVQISIFM